MVSNITKAAIAAGTIMALTFICIHVFSQQTLTTVKFRVDEVDYHLSGPIMGAVADEFRTAYINELRKRGDIEFVSSGANHQVRVMNSITAVVCGEGEGKVGGYSAALLLVSRVTKESIQVDLSIYASPTIQEAAKQAALATVRILGMPIKEDKKAPVVTTTSKIEL